MCRERSKSIYCINLWSLGHGLPSDGLGRVVGFQRTGQLCARETGQLTAKNTWPLRNAVLHPILALEHVLSG